MDFRKWLDFLTIILLLFLVSSCSSQKDQTPSGDASENTARPSVPSEYQNKENPFDETEAFTKMGEDTYKANCEPCHGEKGFGDGALAASLDPKPEPFPLESVEDSYLFWRISEGGMMDPFNSLMPTWKSILSEQQIWEVIAYLRTLQQ